MDSHGPATSAAGVVVAACTALVGAALSLAPIAVAAAGRGAIALVPASESRLSAAELATLCARLSTPCAPATTKAMVATSAPRSRLWLLDSAQPWIAALDEREPTDAARARVWDFAAHRPSVPPVSDGGASLPLRIHPALYPLGASGQAVAIVGTTREMYSGGGAFFDVADFVALDALGATSAAPPNVVYAAVPFACIKTIRACFSEKEYRRSPHCTDDSTGHLTIDFAGTTGAAPGWSFRWHETSWPANVGKSQQLSTRSTFAVPPGARAVDSSAPAATASFCGGPA